MKNKENIQADHCTFIGGLGKKQQGLFNIKTQPNHDHHTSLLSAAFYQY